MSSKLKLARRIVVALIALIIGVAATLWAYDVYQDRQTKIDIMGPVPMYDSFEAARRADFPKFAVKPAGQFLPGEAVQVERIRYSKNFMFFKVQTDKGVVGWITYDPRNVQIFRAAANNQ